MHISTVEQLEKETREIEKQLEQQDMDLGYCMIEQTKIDANIARNVIAIVVKESSEFLLSYAELLNQSDEIILLNEDIEIMSKVKRWRNLIGVAFRSEDFDDMVLSCIFGVMLDKITYDEIKMIRTKHTPVTFAEIIINTLSDTNKLTNNFEIFEYDYSKLMAESERYSAIAKGEIKE